MQTYSDDKLLIRQVQFCCMQVCYKLFFVLYAHVTSRDFFVSTCRDFFKDLTFALVVFYSFSSLLRLFHQFQVFKNNYSSYSYLLIGVIKGKKSIYHQLFCHHVKL